MRRILMCLFCLISFSLTAETIGNVEFFLPDQDWEIFSGLKTDNGKVEFFLPEQGWKITNEFDIPENGITLLYGRKGSKGALFTTAYINVSWDCSSEKAITDSFQEQSKKKLGEDAQIKCNVIDISPQSTLFEVMVSLNCKKLFHGWVRVFSHQKGTTILSYQTDQFDDVDQIRPIWMKVLQEAREINKKTPSENNQ